MKHFFITGTSKGIGKALAELLLNNNQNRVTGISRTSTIKHLNYSHITTDLSNTAETESIFFPDMKDVEEIVLVNNSGVISEIVRAGKYKNLGIIYDYNVNLISPAILMNNFIKKYQLYTNKRTILNISSGAGRHAIDAWSVYCSSKSGLDMFSKTADLEQTFQAPEHRIKILSLAPGVVDTAMQEKLRNSDENEFSEKDKFVNLKKNNELTRPEQVAEQLQKILSHPETIEEVLVDLRTLTN
jgi:benzil reductase ((S)-benzoin forming)